MLTVLMRLVAIHVFVILASLEMEKHAVSCLLHSYALKCKNVCLYTFCSGCVDGAVLLYNGTYISPNFTAGTVLLCYNNAYGTVCDDYWDELEARVVCTQLGHPGPGKTKDTMIDAVTIYRSVKYMHSYSL